MNTFITVQASIKKYAREMIAISSIVVVVFGILVATESVLNQHTFSSANAAEGHSLTVTITPMSGGVVVNAGGGGQIACGENYTQCTGNYNAGEVVHLSVSHETTTFMGWTGCDTSDAYNCHITMDANKTVEARFGSVTPAPAPAPAEPRAPACPLTPSNTLTVVDFGNGGKTQAETSYLLSKNSAHREVVKNVSLAAGTYTVETVSWDGYSSRANVSQSYEQWNTEVRNGSNVLGMVGPTTDIADQVIQDTKQNTFTDALVLTDAANAIAAVHAFPNDTSSPNSVVPICIGFTKKVTSPATPSCTLSANPSTITNGNSATLTLASQNANSATINQGVGTIAVNGTKNVTPSQTTTYTATVTGANNQTATCEATVTVTVTTPDPMVPVCPFTPSANLTVIDFNGGKVRTNANVIVSSTDVTKNTIGPKEVTLVPGTYTVQTYSWDGYKERITVSQMHEQWNAVVKNAAGTILGTAGVTTDVADNVTEAAVTNTFTDVFTLTENATRVYAVHAFPNDTSSANSVVPVCVAFQKKIQNPAKIHGCVYEDVNRSNSKDTGDLAIPETTITLTGTTSLNQSVTRTMQTGTDGCYLFDNLEPGTYRVAETQPAGYDDFSDQIGTKGGTTANDVFSNIVLGSGDFSENNNFGEVKTPVTPPAPVCTLVANPILITQGGFSTLTLTSSNATSATINPTVGTTTQPNGSYTVSPTQTTTYTATVTGANNQTATCSATVTVTTPSALACSMNISSPSVKLGSTITLTWSSQNATSAVIDPQLGTVTTSGSREITIFGDTTYTGTFTGANGQTTTCKASVEVQKGGGGCGSNCGGGGGGSDPKPNIVLSSRTLTPLDSYVYLSSMPYTGFEAGPFTTALFWILVFALSTGVAYAITFLAPGALLAKIFAPVRAIAQKRTIREREVIRSGVRDVAPHLFPAQYTPATLSEPANVNTVAMHVATGTGSAIDENTMIEESAHTYGILLSPEAERIIKAEMHAREGNKEIVLENIFGRATAEYPKEDGWILLSKERITALLGTTEKKESTGATVVNRPTGQGAIHARELADSVERVTIGDTARTFEARVPVAPASLAAHEAPREVKTLAEELKSFTAYRTTEGKPVKTPAEFMEHIVAGKQQEIFEMLRTLASEGKADAFIAGLVRALDEVYKNRIEGGRTPDQKLVMVTAAWSNRDFEEVIRTLVECVDYSYTSNVVGTKVALAKLFEKFAAK